MAKKEDLWTFGKKVAIYGGGGALAVKGASMVTQGTSWSPSTRGLVSGAALFAGGAGIAAKGYPELGAVLGIGGVISAVAGVAYQAQVDALLAQTDAQRAAALTAAGTAALAAPAAAPAATGTPAATGNAPGDSRVYYR